MLADTGIVVIILVLLHHCLLFGSLFFFPLFPSELDLNSVHPPHECDLALCRSHQLISNLVEVLIVALDSLLRKVLSILLPHEVATPGALNLQGTSIDQGVEFTHAEVHPVSEFAQEVLELEHTAQHIPVTARLMLAPLELAPPSLNPCGRLVRTVSVIYGRQLHMKLTRRATLRIEFNW